jgi:regulatory protein
MKAPRPASRPVTAAYLHKAATRYVSARSASGAMVRQTLERRAKRRLAVTALDETTLGLIEAVMSDLAKLGLIDDARFAQARAASLAAKGLPGRRIAAVLRAKGVEPDTIAVAGAADVDELAQARRYVERKRLGRHRTGEATAGTHLKDLRALARAGFSYAVAVKALGSDSNT